MQTSNAVSIVLAVVALVGTIITGFYTYTNRNRELDIELVKIGIGILRADPKETQTKGARGWAIETIGLYSGIKFSEEAKKELLEGKLSLETGWFETGAGYTDYRQVPPTRPK